MSGINFNFNQGADPLLRPAPDYSARLAELEQAQSALDQQKQMIMKLAQGQQTPEVKPAGSTPIWDEIDAITGNMSKAEFEEMQADENYKQSLESLMEFVAGVQLQMIRPHIEGNPEGRKLLEQHLTNVKFLRKAALESANKKMADFEDYTKNYSHLSWEDYLKTKGGKKK